MLEKSLKTIPIAPLADMDPDALNKPNTLKIEWSANDKNVKLIRIGRDSHEFEVQ